MIELADSAYPGPPWPDVAGWLIYAGGDTPNPQPTIRADLPGPLRIPVWVRSNPAQANGRSDALAFFAWLRANRAPRCVVVLDLEAAVCPAYVDAFAPELHAAGFIVWEYGSSSTITRNPQLDGWFVADPTGVAHLVSGSAATQWAWTQRFDLDLISAAGFLWDLRGPPPSSIPQPGEDDMPYTLTCLTPGQTDLLCTGDKAAGIATTVELQGYWAGGIVNHGLPLLNYQKLRSLLTVVS